MSFKTPASKMVVKWWVSNFREKKSFEATQSFSCITLINIKKIYEFLNHYSYYSVIRPSTGLTKEGIIRFTYKSLAHVRVRT